MIAERGTRDKLEKYFQIQNPLSRANYIDWERKFQLKSDFKSAKCQIQNMRIGVYKIGNKKPLWLRW